jgi:hypothetical protein
MPASTPSNVANGSFSINGGSVVSFQLGTNLIQGPCRDEVILFQTQNGQLRAGNHTMEVVYHGDNTKMPLTLCALVATPLNSSLLDIQPSNSNPPPSSTPSSSSTASVSPDSHHPKSHTAIMAGIISGVGVALVILFSSIIWWRRKRAKQQFKSSSTHPLHPFAFHHVPESASDIPIAPHISTKRAAQIGLRGTRTPTDSPQLESRPPSYHVTDSSLIGTSRT